MVLDGRGPLDSRKPCGATVLTSLIEKGVLILT